MAEGWLIEQGIGEDRALLIEHGQVIAARVDWPGELAAGQIEDAKLLHRTTGSTRGTAQFASGAQALVSSLPREANEGGTLRLKVTRAAIAEAGRGKLAHARPTDEAPRPAPRLIEALNGKLTHAFPAGLWDEVFAAAWHGSLDFAGGAIIISPTPAMTVIDIDGTLPPLQLALAAVPALAEAIDLMDLSGSIGIDFPTLEQKADRKLVDVALEAALNHWPHERTAMNGFGFVQLVARCERPSLVARMAHDRAGAAARLLLRRGEQVLDPGTLLLTAHPEVLRAINPAWRADLARRTGRRIEWRPDSALALDGGYAQAVTA